MNDPTKRRDPRAELTDVHEHSGWPKTPQQQVELERRRGAQFPLDDAPAPERSCDEDPRQRDAEWRKGFSKLLRTHRREAAKVRERWEKRLGKQGIPLPTHLKNPVDYVAECRRLLVEHREAHKRTLSYAHELLEEFGSDFGRIRAILDRHQTGSATFAQIERLHETLMAEIAKATSVPEQSSDGGSG